MPSEITVRRKFIVKEYGFNGDGNPENVKVAYNSSSGKYEVKYFSEVLKSFTNKSDADKYKADYDCSGRYPDSNGAHASYVSMHMTIGDKITSGSNINKYQVTVDYITYYSESYYINGGTSSALSSRNNYPLCVLLAFCNVAPDSNAMSYGPSAPTITGGYSLKWENKIPIWYTSTLTSKQPLASVSRLSNYTNSNTYYKSYTETDRGTVKNRVIEIARYTKPGGGSQFSFNSSLFGESSYNSTLKAYLVDQDTYPGVGYPLDSAHPDRYYVKDTSKSLLSRVYVTNRGSVFYIDTNELNQISVWTNTYLYDGSNNTWIGWENAGSFDRWVNHSISYDDNGYCKPGESVPASEYDIRDGAEKTVGTGLSNYSDTTSYTIYFNSNGGSSVSSTSFTKTISHTFGGWKANGITYNPGNPVTVNSDLNFVAQWSHATSRSAITLPTPTKKIKLYYNSNSHGTLSKSSDDINLTFQGWYTAESGGTKIGDGGASYTPTEDGGKTYYAHWGPGSMEGSGKYFPTVDPSDEYSTERAGSGSSERDLWTTSPNGTTEFTRSRTFSDDTTAYIKYRYHVKFYANGGQIVKDGTSYSGDNPYVVIKSHGVSITAPTSSEVKYEVGSGDASVITKTCKGFGDSPTSTSSSISLGGSYAGNAPKKYYAVYQDIKYKVTFDANGGAFPSGTTDIVSGSSNKLVRKEVSYGGTSSTPNKNPVRTGYTFNGWLGDYSNVKSDITIKANWDFTPVWIKKSSGWVKYEPNE